MIMHKVTTLNQFIIERQAEIPGATGEFSRLLHHIGIAAKKVHREVNKAGLVDILGKVGSINVQGEDQQKLDVYADKTFMDELRASGECCGVATEENQDIVVFEEGLSKDGKYIICIPTASQKGWFPAVPRQYRQLLEKTAEESLPRFSYKLLFNLNGNVCFHRHHQE